MLIPSMKKPFQTKTFPIYTDRLVHINNFIYTGLNGKPTKHPLSYGPRGGSKGKCWVYMPKSFIKKIFIARGSYVYGIKFYSVETESSHFSAMEDGTQIKEIYINYRIEYLTSISGMVGTYEGVDVVMSLLCFGTNHNHYGPYGSKIDGTPFSYEGEGVMIVGFHGRTAVTGYLGVVWIYVDKMEPVNLDGSDDDLIGISEFYGYVKGYKGV